MKYKLKQNPIDVTSPTYLEDYFKNSGITKLESFLVGPDIFDEEPASELKNITNGVKMLMKHLKKGSKIYLPVDPDVDGFTSAAIIYQFIKEISPETDIWWDMPLAKEHGIDPDLVDFTFDLAIVPDAGSNQLEETEELSQRMDILIIDHHIADIDISSERVVVINNQTSPNFTNKNLSGAGMVYKFIQYYCEYNFLGEFYEKYVDLAAIGIISDSMDSRQLDNNFLIQKGLNNIHNKMIQALLNKQSFSVSSTTNPTKIDIAFYIAPIINGLIRFGTIEEKENFFRAMIHNDIEEEYERTFRNKTTVENYYEKVARESANVKGAQDRTIAKLVPILQNKIESQGLHKNAIIIYTSPKSDVDEIPKTLTGLIAMKIANYYKKPTLVLRPVFLGKEVLYRGSGRSMFADGFNSFKDYLASTSLVEYASGHDMAFGISLKEANISNLVERANQDLSDIDFGSRVVEVDAVFDIGQSFKNIFFDFAKLTHLYGNGIVEPLFVVKMFVSSRDFMVMGSNRNTFKINHDGVSFIKFRAGEDIDVIQELLADGMIGMEVLGKAKLNEYNGNVSVQMVIEDFNFIETKEMVLF